MLIFIQARLSSKRLPEKVLKKINGLEIIKHVIKNLKMSKHKLKIVVVTSNYKSDQRLITFLKKNNIIYFRNSLSNVLDRLLKCALKYNAKYFIRINGDSPFIDCKVIDKMITVHKANPYKFDLITNVFPRTFPKGQSVEIIKTNCLKNISNKKLSRHHKEHVTKYIYDNNKLFKIMNLSHKIDLSDYSLAVDSQHDFNLYNKKLKNISLKKKIEFEKLIRIIYE
tara:strand:+ start:699 stop:1373 length:675 start_codon:yes stop_codon:yes gene_type:complete